MSQIANLKTDRIITLIIACTAFIVFVITLAPSVSFWDSGEYITCSYTAGVPHPPGVPLFVLLGRVSTIIFFFIPSVAARVNLMCAISGAVTIGILVRLVQRWAGRMDFSPAQYRPMSALAGLLAAWSYTIWRNSNAAETYSTALLLTFVIIWLFDLWLVRYGEKSAKIRYADGGWGEARYLLLISYLLILSVANHGSVPLVTGPPILLIYLYFSLKKRSGIWYKPFFILSMLGLIILAFSIHLYMPIRAIQNPEVNETDASSWEAFDKAFSREQYGQQSIWDRKGPFHQQIGLYLKYLSWQPGRTTDGWNRIAGESGGKVIAVILRILLLFGAIYGFVSMAMKKPHLMLFLLMLFLMASILFVFFILNFKVGLEGTPAGEVRERDYFFGASFALFAMISAVGLVSIMRDFFGKSSTYLAWLLLIIPAAILVGNWYRCDRSESYFARDYGINLLEMCPEGAILITNGDNDTFPLWFAQGVLNVRTDVIVSNLSLMNTNWYIDQLIAKDSLLLSFDSQALVDSLQPVFIWGPQYFHLGEGGIPMASYIDGKILESIFPQHWPWGLAEGNLAVAFPTELETNQGAISMQDYVLIDMVNRRPIHGRDIYFAGTVAQGSRALFDDYLVMEGISFRIGDSTDEPRVNSSRGRQLMENCLFTGLENPLIFKCDQTVQLLRNYYSAYLQLAHNYIAIGEPDSAAMILEAQNRLFATLPYHALQVVPTQAYITATLMDGIGGTQAAIDTLHGYADKLDEGSIIFNDESLVGMALQLRSLADSPNSGYSAEQSFIDDLDLLDDGSPEFNWLRLENALVFGNYIAAWEFVDSIAEVANDSVSEKYAELAYNSLEISANNSSYAERHDLSESGLMIVIKHIDSARSNGMRIKSSSTVSDILSDLYDLVSAGRIVSAISAGNYLASHIDDTYEADLIRIYTTHLIETGIQARETALWYRSSTAIFSNTELAWMAAESGYPSMMYSMLAGSGEVDIMTLEQILQSPVLYCENIPKPGSGSGIYSWVNTLGGD